MAPLIESGHFLNEKLADNKHTNKLTKPNMEAGTLPKNNLPFEFLFVYISASVYWIFEILVPSPHNIPLIMGGWHKNFINPVNISWGMSKPKNQKGVFFVHPLQIFVKQNWCLFNLSLFIYFAFSKNMKLLKKLHLNQLFLLLDTCEKK